MEAISKFFPRIIVILVCFPIHECAHAWMAYKLGDNTARLQGRITLNPFKHLDFFGTALLLLAGVGFAKPVPVNPANFKNRKRDMALTAFAGPLSNMLMAVLILVLLKGGILAGVPLKYYPFIVNILLSAAYINISLAIFNMIPISPLDGFRVPGAILSDETYNNLVRHGSKTGLIVILAIMVMNRMGYSPIGTASNTIFNYLYKLIVL